MAKIYIEYFFWCAVGDQKEIVQVETIEGTNMYRLFEHVTVGIQLKGSEAHAHVLNLR